MNYLLSELEGILIKKGKPLNIYEIAFHIVEFELKKIETAIKDDININGSSSTFFHAGNGKFGLRFWLNKNNIYKEVLTSQIGKINPLEEMIAVFKKQYLNNFIKNKFFTNSRFSSKDFSEYLFPVERKYAETNENLIQLVSCFVIKYKNQLVTFRKTKFQPEKRLNYQKKCINFGGHIAYTEFYSLFDALDPDSFSPFILRELLEEAEITSSIRVNQIGLLYDKSTVIGRQHLGLVYEVTLQDKKIDIKEKKLFTDLKFESIDFLVHTKDDFDSWSKEIIEYYRNEIF